MAKNTAVEYKGTKINIVDTPGHADFGGEVERTLNMVDGVMLLVDASEGPLPQTRFVLSKALAANLPVIAVINKIDRPDRRINEVLNELYDLLIDLDATEEQLDFPVLYTNAKAGIALNDPDEPQDQSGTLALLFETILSHIPTPTFDPEAGTQFLVTNLDYSDYVGRIAVGRIISGSLKQGARITLMKKGESVGTAVLGQVYTYQGLERVSVGEMHAGDIAAVTGVEDVFIGDTLADLENPKALPVISVEEPTMSMEFAVNTSPLAGKEGKLLTSRQILARLEKETLYNVSIRVSPGQSGESFSVSARGELQLAVLVETMRREGFELSLGQPHIISRDIDGVKSRTPGTGRNRHSRRIRGRGHGKNVGPARQTDPHGQPWIRAGSSRNRNPHQGPYRLPQPVPHRHPRQRHFDHPGGRVHALRRVHFRSAQRGVGIGSRRQGRGFCHFSSAAERHHFCAAQRPGISGYGGG